MLTKKNYKYKVYIYKSEKILKKIKFKNIKD